MNWWIIVVIGAISSYVGSFTSGGVSALSIALMTFFWLSPQMASVTFKLGKIWDVLSSTYIFYKSGYIPKKYLFWWAVSLMCGSFIGSSLIFNLSERGAYIWSGITMLVLVGTSFFKKEWQKHFSISKLRESFGYFIYFILAIVGNLFPAGSWVWFYFQNTMVLRLSSLESKWIWSFLSIFWYIWTFLWIISQWIFNTTYAISLTFWMFIGWYFGSKWIVKLGNKNVQRVLLLSIFITGVYFVILWLR